MRILHPRALPTRVDLRRVKAHEEKEVRERGVEEDDEGWGDEVARATSWGGWGGGEAEVLHFVGFGGLVLGGEGVAVPSEFEAGEVGGGLRGLVLKGEAGRSVGRWTRRGRGCAVRLEVDCVPNGSKGQLDANTKGLGGRSEGIS